VPVMRTETRIPVEAPPEVVWKVMSDVESWPELTASMSSVRKRTPGPLRVGSVVHIRQPKLPPTRWVVTELVEPERFVWVARTPGMVSTASHAVTASGTGSVLRLAIAQEGLLAPLVGRLLAGLTRTYVDLEAAGLKQRAEATG
jgi:carbon monoxide dehydrogenase subunit G